MAHGNSRLEHVQMLRGLAATMVVFYHIGLWETKSFGSKLVTPEFLKAGDGGVDIFFVISGFIMIFITQERLASRSEQARFLCRRFARVFPPYWIVSFALLLLWLRKPELFNNYYHNRVDIWRSFLLLPQSVTPLLGVGWSLIHEVYFYVVVSGILVMGLLGRATLLGTWFLIVLLANASGLSESVAGLPVLQVVLSPFSLEFQLGAAVALTCKGVAALRLPTWLFVIAAFTGIIALYVAGQFMPFSGVYPDNNSLIRVGFYGITSFVLVLSMVQVDLAGVARAPAWGVLLGDASYALYLVHTPVINAVYKVAASINPHPGSAAALFWFMLALGASFAVAILFHLKLERRITRLASGFIPAERPKRVAGSATSTGAPPSKPPSGIAIPH
jgi:exopolysaccharide production protein ExoZ